MNRVCVTGRRSTLGIGPLTLFQVAHRKVSVRAPARLDFFLSRSDHNQTLETRSVATQLLDVSRLNPLVAFQTTSRHEPSLD